MNAPRVATGDNFVQDSRRLVSRRGGFFLLLLHWLPALWGCADSMPVLPYEEDDSRNASPFKSERSKSEVSILLSF